MNDAQHEKVRTTYYTKSDEVREMAVEAKNTKAQPREESGSYGSCW
ncbi:MAG: hypothetical protein ACR2PS_00970 [Pseudomonadales bacterium]